MAAMEDIDTMEDTVEAMAVTAGMGAMDVVSGVVMAVMADMVVMDAKSIGNMYE